MICQVMINLFVAGSLVVLGNVFQSEKLSKAQIKAVLEEMEVTNIKLLELLF